MTGSKDRRPSTPLWTTRGLALTAGVAAAVLAACAPSRTEERAAGDSTGAATRATTVAASRADTVTVYKSPTCGCCTKWVDHMRAAGFHVVSVDRPDVTPVKEANGVTPELASCHTAIVRGYAIEGHVPAVDVLRLLTERPGGVRGLAAPGMPNGSPGMEGPTKDRYDVVAFDSAGARRVFASH